MPEYTVHLSEASFRDLAEKVRKYRDRLESLVTVFCEELARSGVTVISAILSEHVYTAETIGSVHIVSESADGVYTARIVMESDAIMFLEFGSGLLGAADEHPTGLYGAGTFGQAERQDPEYENWENPEGWTYIGDDGKIHKSYGMQASMPMYRGAEAMQMRLNDIATRVFSHA